MSDDEQPGTEVAEQSAERGLDAVLAELRRRWEAEADAAGLADIPAGELVDRVFAAARRHPARTVEDGWTEAMPTKLGVVITPESVRALRRIIDLEDISLGLAVHRLLTLGDFTHRLLTGRRYAYVAAFEARQSWRDRVRKRRAARVIRLHPPHTGLVIDSAAGPVVAR